MLPRLSSIQSGTKTFLGPEHISVTWITYDARLSNPNINAEFSHWESTAGNIIFPHQDSIEASVMISGVDTLIAVFDVDYTTVDEPFESALFEAYPVPATDNLNIKMGYLKASDSILHFTQLMANNNAKQLPAADTANKLWNQFFGTWTLHFISRRRVSRSADKNSASGIKKRAAY